MQIVIGLVCLAAVLSLLNWLFGEAFEQWRNARRARRIRRQSLRISAARQGRK